MVNIYYLSHGGPGSGRYPLGSGERPYQNVEGPGGRNQRKRGGILGYIRERKARKAEEKEQRERNDELRRAMEAERKKRELEIDKERVLREGSAVEVMKYKGKISNTELQTAVTRLNLESQLEGYAAKETKSALEKFDTIMRTVKTTTEWAKIGTETYNTFAAIYNATPDGQNKPLRLVGKGEKKKNEGGNS